MEVVASKKGDILTKMAIGAVWISLSGASRSLNPFMMSIPPLSKKYGIRGRELSGKNVINYHVDLFSMLLQSRLVHF